MKRTHTLCLLFLVLLSLMAESDLYAQWKKISSIAGGLNFLYNNHGVIWGSSLGIGSSEYKTVYSLDTGKTWTTKFASSGATLQFLDSLNGGMISRLPTASGNELQKTTDAGASWTVITTPSNFDFTTFTFAGSINNIVLGGLNHTNQSAQIYATTNGGTSWILTSAPHGVRTPVFSAPSTVAFVVGTYPAPFNPSSIYIWHSSDKGLTWTEKFYGQDPDYVDVYYYGFIYCNNTRLVFPASNCIAYTDDLGATIKKSGSISPRVKSTTSVPSVNNGFCQSRNAMFCQGFDKPPFLLNAGTFRSIDEGVTWVNIGGPGSIDSVQNVCALNNNILIAVDENGDVWRTDNCGGHILNSPGPTISPKQIVMNECSVDSMNVVLSGLSCRNYHITALKLRGADTASLTLSPHKLPFLLLDGASDTLRITLDAKLKLGRIRDSIRITYYEEGDETVRDTTLWLPYFINALPPDLQANATALDFPATQICAKRDKSIQLRNNGCDTLLIIAGPKLPAEFSCDALTLPITMPPGTVKTVQIHFHPAYPATYDGNVHFTAEHKGFKQSVDIPISGIGFGEYESLSLKDPLKEFLPVSPCILQRDTIVAFINKSCDTLRITSGPDSLSQGFTAEPVTMPILLYPDELFKVHFYFRETEKGNFSANAYFNLISQGNEFQKKFTLNGISIGADASPSLKDSEVKFHTVTNCTPLADTVIPFTNYGCDTLKIVSGEIATTDIFTWDAPTLPIVVPPEATIMLHFIFHPVGITGSFQSGAHLLVAQGDITHLIKFSLKGRSSDLSNPGPTVLQSEYYFDSTSIFGGRKDTTITFTNRGCDDLQIISGPTILGEGFSWDEIPLPLTLASNESQNVTFHFQPTHVGKYSSTTNVITERSGKSQRIDLYFEGYGTEIRSSVITANSADGILILSIRPNPAQDEIVVEVSGTDSQSVLGYGENGLRVRATTVSLYDALGREVIASSSLPLYQSTGRGSFHIDTRNLSGGVYLLRIGSASQRFVKVK
jgi:hypothetical protein